jgi:hypothetical protein
MSLQSLASRGLNNGFWARTQHPIGIAVFITMEAEDYWRYLPNHAIIYTEFTQADLNKSCFDPWPCFYSAPVPVVEFPLLG